MKYIFAGITLLGVTLAGVWTFTQSQQEKIPAPTPASSDADLKQLKNLKLYD